MQERDTDGPDWEPPGGSTWGTPDDAARATARYREVAGRVLEALFESDPEWATDLGVHTYDDQLTDLSADGIAARAGMVQEALAALDDVDDTGLPIDDRVDLEILRTALSGQAWTLGELREHETNPLLHLPGDALYPLIVREAREPAERLRSIAARLAAVPHRLEVARTVLHDMPRVHVETAMLQAQGAAALLGPELEALVEREPTLRAEVEPVRVAARAALADHVRWLEAQLPVSDGDPRLGEQAYAARLWYSLDTETGPDALLTRAESDLQAMEEEIAEMAATIAGRPARAGQVRDVLDALAASAPVTDHTILSLCEQALEDATRRVREADLVTVPDTGVQIIVMPESRRGVAVAYCDAPGPLEPGARDGTLPTFFAVSPTPEGWPAERVASFYREYNGHMLRNLAVHEAMPGHVLQLAHNTRHEGSTRVRSAFRSGPFVEGWAVYAEQLMATAGFGLGPEVDAGLRMQQLKMQLRTTINAILDVRVHARGMTEAEAMALMTVRGHQEEGEAAGKWRRALLTSAQLSTYYVGYREMVDTATRLREANPGLPDPRRHDRMLAYGSPPPRHLKRLLGLNTS